MKLFNFRQNNSGGSFQIDENLTVNVTIEANTYKGANKRAKDVGIYFNGCSNGWDCDCCGDRWDKLSSYDDEHDGYTVFEFDDKEAALAYFGDEFNKDKSYSANRIIYFKDGTKQSYANGAR